MKRFLSKASVLVVSSFALVGLLTGCHDEDKHANKPVAPVAPVVKPQPKPKPFVFVINSDTSYVQSKGQNHYTFSIPVSSIKQVIAYTQGQQSRPVYITGSSISQAFPVFAKYNQNNMNGVISSRQLLPRFVHFIDESYNGHVVTYHLQSSLPFNQSSIRHITITFSQAGTH